MRDADPGLFGPASVTWQMHGDPMMWIAGVRALYLQALHPRAVRGVTQNSDFRRDAWGRLLRTADFVGTITYGTTLQAERAGAKVRGIHRRLSATDPDSGERFPVDDPGLLLWVHCAEIDSYLEVARRSGFPCPTRRPTPTSPNSARPLGWWAWTRRRSPATPSRSPPTARRCGRSSPRPPRPWRSSPSCRGRPCPGRCCPCGSPCGAGPPHWPTPRCRPSPTSCTGGPPRPSRSPGGGCAARDCCCARSPPTCAGNCPRAHPQGGRAPRPRHAPVHPPAARTGAFPGVTAGPQACPPRPYWVRGEADDRGRRTP